MLQRTVRWTGKWVCFNMVRPDCLELVEWLPSPAQPLPTINYNTSKKLRLSETYYPWVWIKTRSKVGKVWNAADTMTPQPPAPLPRIAQKTVLHTHTLHCKDNVIREYQDNLTYDHWQRFQHYVVTKPPSITWMTTLPPQSSENEREMNELDRLTVTKA